MADERPIPWKEIGQILLRCGEQRNPRRIGTVLLESLRELIPYDKGTYYYITSNHKVETITLANMDATWNAEFLDYYSQLEGGRYGVYPQADPSLAARGWNATNWEVDGYVSEVERRYMKAQGIKYGLVINLHDDHGELRSIIAMTRTSGTMFSKWECAVVDALQPHIDNLHKNLFVSPRVGNDFTWGMTQFGLTEREDEICDLLCQGASPATIADTLFISRATVYRHVNNIHKKLGVSSRAELILKIIQAS